MKKQILIFVTICLSSVYNLVSAQSESDGIQVLGFGGPLFEVSSINGGAGFFTGGGGAVTLNNFFIGGYGMNLRNNVSQTLDNQTFNLHFEHGGFWLGYMFPNSKKITFSVSSKIGWGEVGFLRENQLNFIKRNTFVLTPELNAEIKISRFFRVGVGVMYRLTDKLESPLLKNSNLNGLGGNLTLRFGWF
jgi:hypothetical protein